MDSQTKALLGGIIVLALILFAVLGGGVQGQPMANAQGGFFEEIFGGGESGPPPSQGQGRQPNRIDFRRLPRNDQKEGWFTRRPKSAGPDGGRPDTARDANGNICQIGTCSQPDMDPTN